MDTFGFDSVKIGSLYGYQDLKLSLKDFSYNKQGDCEVCRYEMILY
ncbi:hypothetical protein P615_12250 [Brevibacillus laterosporus PE36]|nr:hypothetical protein P615_12250 [Brevibacillus laterosporus PE36]